MGSDGTVRFGFGGLCGSLSHELGYVTHQIAVDAELLRAFIVLTIGGSIGSIGDTLGGNGPLARSSLDASHSDRRSTMHGCDTSSWYNAVELSRRVLADRWFRRCMAMA
jgi:hypothetical protein